MEKGVRLKNEGQGWGEEWQVGGQLGNTFRGLAKGSRIFPLERGRPKTATLNSSDFPQGTRKLSSWLGEFPEERAEKPSAQNTKYLN